MNEILRVSEMLTVLLMLHDVPLLVISAVPRIGTDVNSVVLRGIRNVEHVSLVEEIVHFVPENNNR